MTEPQDLAEAAERQPTLPLGDQERLNGYGVMGLPFAGGDILALRRFMASSVGPGYTSIWHRAPDGAWTFYQNAPPAQSCPRYFSNALVASVECDIGIRWTAPRQFTVTMSGANTMSWDVELGASPVTTALNSLSRVLPATLWRSSAFLKFMAAAAGTMLRAGRLGMTGTAPNGQRFQANPRLIWLITKSSATLDGRDFGPLGSSGAQAKLGDFWIPDRGLFVIGQALFEPFDPARHVLPASAALVVEAAKPAQESA